MALDIGEDNPALLNVDERQKLIMESNEYKDIEKYVYTALERVGNTPVNISFVKKYLALWVVLELTLPSDNFSMTFDLTQAPKIKTVLAIMDDLGKKLELNKLGVLGESSDDIGY